MKKRRVTPSNIQQLAPHEVFVFGSNESGFHAGGAANAAHLHFGARYGQGFGRAGASFAIPSLDWELRELKLKNIQFYVRRFIRYARHHTEDTFLVTAIGCGIAGRTPAQMAPLFKGARKLKNVYLPEEFWEILEK